MAKLKWATYLALGGMNSSWPPPRLAPGQCVLLQNVQFDRRNLWSIRRGYSQVASTIDGSPTILELIGYTKSTGQAYLVALDGTNLYYTQNLSEAFTDGGALPQSGTFDWEVFNNLLIIARQTSTMKKFDGNTVSDLGGEPPSNIRCIKAFRNYLFAAQNNSSRLYFSAIGDPESWNTGADFIDINKDDGDWIMGLGRLGNQLVVFKRYNTYALVGYSPDTFQVIPVLRGIGCVNHRTIQEAGTSLIWQSESSVYRLAGPGLDEASRLARVALERIGRPIEATLESANSGFKGKGLYYWKEGWYILTIDEDGDDQADAALVYDIEENRWTKFTDYPFASLALTAAGIDTLIPVPVGGGYASGKVYRLDYGSSDDGSEISFKIETGELDCGHPYIHKTFTRAYIWLLAESQNIDPRLDVLVDGNVKKFDVPLTPPTADRMEPVGVNIDGHGRVIQFKIRYSGTYRLHIGGIAICFELSDFWP